MTKKYKNGKQNQIEKLFEAVERGSVVEVDDLLEKGVSADSRDDMQRTPLMVAAEAGNELVKTLLDHGADVNAVDIDGETALMAATYSGHLDVVKLLDSHGADLSVRNNHDSTALDIAQAADASEIAAYLAAQSASKSDTAEAENAPEADHEGLATYGPAEASIEDDESGNTTSVDAEPEESSEIYGGDIAEEPEDVTARSTATGAALAHGNTSVEPHGDEEAMTALSREFPEFFTQAGRMSPEELTELCDSTDRESESLMKRTSRVLASHSQRDKDLLAKIKSVRGRKTHIETIRRWSRAGNVLLFLEKTGEDTELYTTYQLEALSRVPDQQDMINLAREVVTEGLSVRDINKKVLPMVKRKKLQESGQLTEMSPFAAEIIEALDDPENLMRDVDRSMLLQNAERLSVELTFPELSRIHEKAGAVEARQGKEKKALEQKAEKYVPVIHFLRLIRKTIARAFEGETN